MNWIHTEDEFEGRPIEEALIEQENRQENRQRMIEGLAGLTPKQREALLLTVGLELTQEETAYIAGVTQQAISCRMKVVRNGE